MKLNQTKFIRLSRDRSFLIKAALGIGLVAGVIGFAVSFFTFGVTSSSFFSLADLDEREKNLQGEIESLITDRTTEQLADWIRYSRFKESEDDAVSELYAVVDRSVKINTEEKALLKMLVQGLHGDEKGKKAAREKLEKSVSNSATMIPRFTEVFYADLLVQDKKYGAAIVHFRGENERFDDAFYSRMRVLDLLELENNEAELRRLYRTEKYGGEYTLYLRTRLAAKFKHFGYLFKVIVENDVSRFHWWSVILATISASIWFVIIGQFGGLARHQIAGYFISVVLGVFSTVLTLYFGVIQRDLLNFKFDAQNQSPLDQLIYCVAGIGLREELMKLICFIPIAIYLRKRNDDTTALICAAMVGLGFAFLENLGYFGKTPSFTPWGRFLTANFAHAALTGVIGLSFYRMLRRRGRGWEDFLAAFLLMVFAHGMYDAALMMPVLSEYAGLGSFFILAGVAFRFFREANSLQRVNSSQAISSLGVFVISSALLVGIIFVAVCVGVPFVYALSQYIMSLAGEIVIIFIFINQFRDA